MQRLPKLAVGSAEWRFPLREQVAERLAAALLAPDDRQRSDLFAEALRDEPALAVWTVLRLPGGSQAAINSVEQLAELFSQHALGILQWIDEELLVDPQCAAGASDLQTAKQCAELAKHSRAVSRQAVSLARAAGAIDNEVAAAELIGLLSDAEQWLAACRSDKDSADAEMPDRDALPAWLKAALTAVSQSASCAANFVAVARQKVNDGPSRDSADKDSAISSSTRANLLPQLTRRLARLHELETRFAETLEREKVESLYHFAYGASHEINNPLANISSRAQLLLRDETDHRRRELLASINAQAFRGHEMILNVMHFARPPHPVLQEVDLAALADQVVAELAADAQQQGTLILRSSGDAPLIARVDPDHIAVALRALCVNSLESLGVGGRVEVAVRRASDTTSEKAWAELIVRDTGPGIPDEVRPHVFDPFYSGREAGRGLGFGLSKCWRIVAQHGGRIDVAGDKSGVLFTLRLPLTLAESADQKAAG